MKSNLENHQPINNQPKNNQFVTADAARRAYWTQQMEEAFGFMEVIREYPVEECGETLAFLPEAAEAAGVKVQFSDSKIALDFERVFYLREGLIQNFINAARAFNERGWVMKVEDGFRTLEMQQSLSRKPEVFDAILKSTMCECNGLPSPEFLLRRVTVLTATRPKIGTHMSGSAIDISVFELDGNEVERGGPYLEMSPKTPMESPFVSKAALENRRAIRRVMEENGFVAYPFEFWHFNGGDAYGEFLTQSKKPARYGAVHFDVKKGIVEPVENPQELLQSPAVMADLIEQSLQRLRESGKAVSDKT